MSLAVFPTLPLVSLERSLHFRLRDREQTPRECDHALELLAWRWLGFRLGGHRRRLPRRRWRRLLALRRSGAQVGAGQVRIGEALADNGGQHAHEASPVIRAPVIEPMHLLVNIPEQMK